MLVASQYFGVVSIALTSGVEEKAKEESKNKM